MHDRKIENEILPLGFTFSFPCQQEGLAKAKLTKWTKGFSCSDVEGHDVVAQLQEAIERRNDVKIEVCAILNDTTGCLMSSAWRDDRCRIGLILGTGTVLTIKWYSAYNQKVPFKKVLANSKLEF